MDAMEAGTANDHGVALEREDDTSPAYISKKSRDNGDNSSPSTKT
jgi:hypothetical protein